MKTAANSIWAILLVIQLVVFTVLRNSTEFISEMYVPFFRVFSSFYVKFFSKIPFSVGDCLYVFLVLFLLYKLFLLVKFLQKKEYKSLYRNLNHILLVGNVLVFCFYLFWGFLYGNNRLSEQFPSENIHESELKKLSDYYLHKCEKEREEFPFSWKEIPMETMVTHLQTSQNILPTELPFRNAFSVQNVKKSLFSSWISYAGIGGYFNPFTFEANTNAAMPTHKIPFVTAHEMAHQLGYATEDEANFIGFMSCTQSENRQISYSGNYMALKYILRELNKTDSVYVQNSIRSFSRKMAYDRQIELQFYEQHEGKMSEFFSSLNNLFLQANKQEGLQSYNRFTQLLVGYHRKYGEKVLK